MPRRLKLRSVELGSTELQLIYSYGGEWEPEWRPLQGSAIAGLFTVVSKEVMDHALHGWTSPLIKALGVPPKGALRKLPLPHKLCADRETCPHHDKSECQPTARDMPWCFTPSEIKGDEARILANEVIQLWRQEVYVLVVTEESKHG